MIAPIMSNAAASAYCFCSALAAEWDHYGEYDTMHPESIQIHRDSTQVRWK